MADLLSRIGLELFLLPGMTDLFETSTISVKMKFEGWADKIASMTQKRKGVTYFKLKELISLGALLNYLKKAFIRGTQPRGGGGGLGTLFNGLYREAPPERGTFFRLQV